MEVSLARRVSPWSDRTHRAERLGVAFEDADAAEVGCSGGIACGDWGSPRLGHPRCGLDPVRRAVGERFTTAPVGAGGWQLLGSQQGGHRLLGQRLRDGLGQQQGPEVRSTGTFLTKFGSPRHRQRPVPDGKRQPASPSTPRATSTSSTSSPTGSRSSTPPGPSSPRGAPWAPATASSTPRPGIATDSSGNVYVADTGNNRIQEFDSSGGTSSPSGEAWAPGTASSPPLGRRRRLHRRRLRRRLGQQPDPEVRLLGQLHHQVGKPWGRATASSAPPLRRSTSRSAPPTTSIVVDPTNNRVEKFRPIGTFITKWGTAGSGTGQFTLPSGVAIASAGEVYVVDQGNSRVERVPRDRHHRPRHHDRLGALRDQQRQRQLHLLLPRAAAALASSAASTPPSGRAAAPPRPTRTSPRAPTPSEVRAVDAAGKPRPEPAVSHVDRGRGPRRRHDDRLRPLRAHQRRLARRSPSPPRSRARASSAASTRARRPTGRAAARRSPTELAGRRLPHVRRPGHRRGREHRRRPRPRAASRSTRPRPTRRSTPAPPGPTNDASPVVRVLLRRRGELRVSPRLEPGGRLPELQLAEVLQLAGRRLPHLRGPGHRRGRQHRPDARPRAASPSTPPPPNTTINSGPSGTDQRRHAVVRLLLRRSPGRASSAASTRTRRPTSRAAARRSPTARWPTAPTPSTSGPPTRSGTPTRRRPRAASRSTRRRLRPRHPSRASSSAKPRCRCRSVGQEETTTPARQTSNSTSGNAAIKGARGVRGHRRSPTPLSGPSRPGWAPAPRSSTRSAPAIRWAT